MKCYSQGNQIAALLRTLKPSEKSWHYIYQIFEIFDYNEHIFMRLIRVETKGFNSQVHCFESSLIVSNIRNLKNHIYILYKIICKMIVYKQNKSCIMLQWI